MTGTGAETAAAVRTDGRRSTEKLKTGIFRGYDTERKRIMREYQIENEVLKASVREMGAELSSLVKKESGTEYLWSGDARYWSGISPILFPVVGNFRDKQYRYEGKTYTMQQHGFARRRNFRLVSRTEEEIWLALEDDEETYAQYPFRFCLEAGYRLEGNFLRVMWRVRSREGKTMYFSIGGHPAIRCPLTGTPDKTVGYLGFENEDEFLDYLLVDPATNRVGDKYHSFHLDGGVHRITKDLFDYDALMFDNYQVKTAWLAGADKVPYIRLHTQAPVTAFWSPEKTDAPFVCFEPWYGIPDGVDFSGTLEERRWGQKAEAGQTFEAEYSLEIL